MSEEMIKLLRCPVCVAAGKGDLELYRESWFICQTCGRKYPIVNGIPYMMIPEGTKWMAVAKEQLSVPPAKPD